MIPLQETPYVTSPSTIHQIHKQTYQQPHRQVTLKATPKMSQKKEQTTNGNKLKK
jgi:hypothetical protein